MRTLALALLGVTLLVAPAQAADPMPLADQLLWCSSAFYWLSASAGDAGDNVQADQFSAWSDTLSAQGHDLLVASGLSEDQIQARMDDFDSSVASELGTPSARFDVKRCPDLVAAAPQPNK